MLIRSYGEYWSPDFVDWGRRGRGGKGQLLGEFGAANNRRTVDVWDQRGVYILHDAWEVVYVGKADGTRLGSRLKAHLGDRHAGRWDRFSWYGVMAVVNATTGKGKLGAEPTAKNADVSVVIATLESFLLAVDPPRNRRREKIPNAQEVVQASAGRPQHASSALHVIQDRLDAIEAGLKDLRDDVQDLL